MQSVKGAEFLYITFLLVLFTAAPAAAVFETVMVPLTRMYASHKFYLILDILNLKLLLYLPFHLSFISTQSLVLKSDG